MGGGDVRLVSIRGDDREGGPISSRSASARPKKRTPCSASPIATASPARASSERAIASYWPIVGRRPHSPPAATRLLEVAAVARHLTKVGQHGGGVAAVSGLLVNRKRVSIEA